MKPVFTEKAPKPVGHYVQAMKHKDMLFVSGQLPIHPQTGKIPKTIDDQTRLVLSNVRQILEAEGSSLSNVIKTTVYISDISLWDKVNRVYSEEFGNHKPARAVVPTRELHFGCLVEIEAVAIAKIQLPEG